jgi:serine phosphatase RsbU (regulator of sigma subunit)
MPLEPGDLFFVLADGIAETASTHGMAFGPQDAPDIIPEHQQKTPAEVLEALLDATGNFRGAAPRRRDNRYRPG